VRRDVAAGVTGSVGVCVIRGVLFLGGDLPVARAPQAQLAAGGVGLAAT
jgi:hypothetical protein